MTPAATTLVMAGAREAHSLVIALRARGRRVVASLPEAGRMFSPLPVETRVGEFSGADEVGAWMRHQGVATVLDASHAFDDRICEMVSAASMRMGLRYLRVLRPPWHPTPADRWQTVSDLRKAVACVPDGARVFTNTGWPSLPDYACFKGARLFVRQTTTEGRSAPFEFVTFVEGRPPFSQFQEQALFQSLRISHLICRNVGGAASMSKLLAARRMGLPVLMVDRAPLPAGRQVVETVAEALTWEADG